MYERRKDGDIFSFWHQIGHRGKKVEPLLQLSAILPIAHDWALTGNTRVIL